MFAGLQADIIDRLFTAERLFHVHVADVDFRSRLGAAAKGLTFVPLYSVYEYAVKTSVRAAILEVKQHGILFRKVRPSLLGLVLDSQVRSVVDSGKAAQWDSRISLFAKSACADPVEAHDYAFPDDGSHFRESQIRTIWSVFGISKPIVPRPAMLPLINELVGHRNAIAHGDSRPEEIGRRFTLQDILKKFSDTRDLCVHIVSTLQGHCSKPKNLRR